MGKETRAIASGTVYAEVTNTDFPLPDRLLIESELVGNSYEISIGGSPMHFARVAASLGLEVVGIANTGQDSMRSVVYDLAQQAKITPEFISSPDVQTNIGVHYVRSDGASIITSSGTANQSLQVEDIIPLLEKHRDSTYFYIGGCFKLKRLLPDLHDLIKTAKQLGMFVAMDHGRINNTVTKDDIEAVRLGALASDLYLPSRDEFLRVWDTESMIDGLNKFEGDGIVVVKNGPDGALSKYIKNIYQSHSFPVNQINNTIGAGDSFNAGFIKARSLHLSFEACLQYAHATAALKISKKLLPTATDVALLLNDTV